jgi:diketogulonate reductase-like aldo/keto reductase
MNTMILNDTYTLTNGIQIPKLGLGTWFIDDDHAAEAVRQAVAIGYRHIDTAQAYANEAGVGEGIRTCGLARDDLFVTSKLAAEIKTYDDAVAAIDESLTTTGLDHLDLMIIHSPQPWQHFGDDDRYLAGNREAWRALEDAYATGKVRAIGLSNFQQPDIDNILSSCTTAPMINQILAHISNMPTELITYSQQHGMLVEAYSPIAHGELLKNQHVAEIAQRYNVTIPQLSIRYLLQLGLLPIPKTANPVHMRANADVDFELADADMTLLGNVAEIDNYGESSAFPVFNRS